MSIVLNAAINWSDKTPDGNTIFEMVADTSDNSEVHLVNNSYISVNVDNPDLTLEKVPVGRRARITIELIDDEDASDGDAPAETQAVDQTSQNEGDPTATQPVPNQPAGQGAGEWTEDEAAPVVGDAPVPPVSEGSTVQGS